MNKKELVNAIAERGELTKKDATKVLEAVVDTITEELGNGGSVALTGFGKFEVRTRAARDGHNPATGEKIRIEETRIPAFKAGKHLKEIVKGS